MGERVEREWGVGGVTGTPPHPHLQDPGSMTCSSKAPWTQSVIVHCYLICSRRGPSLGVPPPYPTLPYPTLPYPTPALPYPTLPCPTYLLVLQPYAPRCDVVAKTGRKKTDRKHASQPAATGTQRRPARPPRGAPAA